MRAVVRLSGPDALMRVQDRFRPLSACGRGWLRTFRATRGCLLLDGRRLRVPVTLYVMRAPHSYTREHVVELHIPGSPAVADMVLDELLERGPGSLRLAEPGEFTRRAFLNGRIDLAQAEAVLAVIRAQSETELLAASARLQGSASVRCAGFQEEITQLRVNVEAALDFAEHGIELIGQADFARRCRRLLERLELEVQKGREELASDGAIHAVICGPPNAGKSSLLNRLAGSDRSLVHRQAGTTRDVVNAEIEVAGIRFRLSDTAGLTAGALRAAQDGGKVEGPDGQAVRKALGQIRSCQLLLLVLDGSAPLPNGAIEPARAVSSHRVVCVINKRDLPQVLGEKELRSSAEGWELLHTSALTGQGVEQLRALLGRLVIEGRLDASAADCLFNARQRAAVRRAMAEVRQAEAAVADGMGYEFAAFNLRMAAAALGEVTGEVGPQDVLDRVFSQFCIGK